jgi:hypothetical protein
VSSSNYITIEDVRNYVQDRTIEDNDLELDLAFSDPEIQEAMKSAARAYNSVPPLIGNVDWRCLDGTTNMFLDAIAEQLFRPVVARLSRNDLEFDAGGVRTNIDRRVIDNYRKLISEYHERWSSVARTLKVHANLQRGFFSQ